MTSPTEGSPRPVVLVPGSPLDPSIRAEIEGALRAYPGRLGDVFRALEEGLTPDQIANRLEVASSNFVWNYRTTIEATLGGAVPSAPTVALQTLRRVRRLLSAETWSTDATAHLDQLRRDLERRSDDEEAVEEEVAEAQQKTAAVEAQDVTGVYVYALPHYLRYPYEPSTGRTLFKVGQSGSDVIRRFQAQTRTTALPEEPVLLRVYPTDLTSAARTECQFHTLLVAADHSRSVARIAGKEWFLTKPKFLDAIATALGLDIRVVNDAALDDD